MTKRIFFIVTHTNIQPLCVPACLHVQLRACVRSTMTASNQKGHFLILEGKKKHKYI